MKKLLAILLCLVMVLGLAACGSSDDDKKEETTAAAKEETTAAQAETTAAKEETTAAPAGGDETTAAPGGEGETKELHPLYLIEDRNNLQGLISPVQLVDRSGIEKALPTEQKSDLFIGYSGGSLMSSFFVDIQNGFIDKCEEYGYKHSELMSENDTSAAFTNVDTLIAQSVDGIVLSGDGDAISTEAETAVQAGIPCDSINVPNNIMNHMITAVTNGDFNGGYVTGLYVGENLYYPQWKDQADPVKTTVMFGQAGQPITMSKLCGILTGIIESVTKCQGNPIAFEDAAYASNDYITELALNGTLEVPEINMLITGYGEGKWVTADALSAAEDLFTATPDMQLMMCDNDYMAIGGILAAQAVGINIGTDCFFFACSDGTMVALEYVRDGLMFCTGVNCAYALGWGNVEIFHMIYEEGYDASDMPNQTLIDTIALTAENFDQYYDPSIELVRDTTIEFYTTQEKLATYDL